LTTKLSKVYGIHDVRISSGLIAHRHLTPAPPPHHHFLKMQSTTYTQLYKVSFNDF
jgi:hypothetical protein